MDPKRQGAPDEASYESEEWESSVLVRRGNRVEVRELDTAIYMESLARPELRISIRDVIRRGVAQHVAIFYDPEHRARSLEIEFANSPHVKWCAAQRGLKRLIRRDSNERPT